MYHMTFPLKISLLFKVHSFNFSRHIRSFKMDMTAEIKTPHLK